MAKVILICGKICSGKTYYSNMIKDKYNAVIISPDEATYELINNEYNIHNTELIIAPFSNNFFVLYVSVIK